MTKIRIASKAGFCFGVRRAITLAEQTARKKSTIYTLGPLIHNPQEISRLARRGIKPIKSPGRIKERDATLILRTHGIPALLRKRLESMSLRLVDATCPFVKRAQEIVKKLNREKYFVIIVGDKTHPEVIALVSYAKGRCLVIEKPSDLKKIPVSDKIGIVSQTTQTPETFSLIIKSLLKANPGAKIYNTICRATIDRQSEAKHLAGLADVMIVVGGKNSGNTRRLFEICRKLTKTRAIETASELKKEWFKNAEVVGISAGASTPDWIICKVKDTIKDITLRQSN